MGYTGTSLNKIQNASLAFLENEVTHIAVGTGTTPFNQAQNELNNEQFRKPTDKVSVTNDEIRTSFRFDVTEANGLTFTEIGEFDDATAGNMLSRSLVTPKEKTSQKEFVYLIRTQVNTRNV